jgi:hypothetical protein
MFVAPMPSTLTESLLLRHWGCRGVGPHIVAHWSCIDFDWRNAGGQSSREHAGASQTWPRRQLSLT